MKKLVLTTAIILGLAMGSNAQQDPFDFEEKEDEVIIFKSLLHRSSHEMTRDDEAGLYLPGDGFHGIFGNADATDTYYDGTVWDWQSHLPDAPLGSGALLLIGFGAAYAMMKRKKED